MFIDKLKQESLGITYNQSITENGALGYATTGGALLDLNFATASLRHATSQEIIDKFKAAYTEDKDLALKWLFFARDIREGMGERNLFRVVFKNLAQVCPETIKNLIPLVSEYGRFDDLFCLLEEPSQKVSVLHYINTQLTTDIERMEKGEPISLLAKWLPSPNCSSKETKRLAHIVYSSLSMKESEYRKLLSKLRAYIKIVETQMSSNNWDKINYAQVPSKANLNYSNAFKKHDPIRRLEFLDSLQKGETKINSATLFPHEIVHKYDCYAPREDASLEALWKALPNTVPDNNSTLVVADVSGSMYRRVSQSSQVTAADISYALAIYFSEHLKGEYANKAIIFSSHPHYIDFSKDTSLYAKVSRLLGYDDCSNTDLEKTFNLILDTAVNNHLSQEDLPKNILIISDMEFDTAFVNPYAVGTVSLMGKISNKFTQAGYQMPRLVFWNVNSRTNTIPMTTNPAGVALVSGFSQNVAKMVMSVELDPYKCLLETLLSKRYEQIHGYCE